MSLARRLKMLEAASQPPPCLVCGLGMPDRFPSYIQYPGDPPPAPCPACGGLPLTYIVVYDNPPPGYRATPGGGMEPISPGPQPGSDYPQESSSHETQ
ncbi:MAG: hypothetical protein FJ316_10680 [SAR202 cluster bacterium]|nr:hypothetical protein [SAR202 cluster bacterium]